MYLLDQILTCPYVRQAEHHSHALGHLDNVFFYQDHKAGRVGVLTTENVKFSAMQIVNIMLRERRISICKHMHSREKRAMLVRLREQCEIYSFQFKEAANTFQKSRTALSGKVGGTISLILLNYTASVKAHIP